YAAFWSLFAACLTIVTRSLAAGIGVTMAALFVGDITLGLISGLGKVGKWVSRVFPNTALNELVATSGSNLAAADWAWITANLVGYVVLLLAIAVIRFRRMNMISSGGG